MGMEAFMGDFRGSCSPAECLGRTSIGPLSESDEECREDDDDDGEEEAEEREAAQQAVFERDCTELDLNLIEENWHICKWKAVLCSSFLILFYFELIWTPPFFLDHHRRNTPRLLATNQQGSQEQHLLSLNELG